MAMGIVSDAEFEAEVKVMHQEIERGRGHKKEVPNAIRKIIAEDAILSDESATDIANEFGVSNSSVAAYKNGATSTASYHNANESLKESNDRIRAQVITTARSKMLAAMGEITESRLKNAKLRDLSIVARDMSTIISNTEPRNQAPQVGAQFIFHVPQTKKESDFEVIDVGA